MLLLQLLLLSTEVPVAVASMQLQHKWSELAIFMEEEQPNRIVVMLHLGPQALPFLSIS